MRSEIILAVVYALFLFVPRPSFAETPPSPAAERRTATSVSVVSKEEKRTDAGSAAADPYGVTLTVKLGSFQLVGKNQQVDSLNRVVSTSGVVYGLEGEWRHKDDFAVSLELLSHSRDYTTTASPQSGEVDLSYILINAKKYFKTDNWISGTVIQPYIGAGIGRATARYSAGGAGGVTESIDSNAAQAMAGVIFRWQHVDLYTEYKYLHDKHAYAGESNYSGNGLFIGASVHF